MKRFKVLLAVVVLAAPAALVMSGCSKEPAKRVLAPRTIRLQEVRDARFIEEDAERRDVTERAARSPLVARAIGDQIHDSRLAFVPSGVVAAVGTADDGSAVRFTVLPYQYTDDVNHALYFALLEWKGQSKVETFEMLRNRKPDANSGFQPLNDARHGLWLRQGPDYVLAQTGVERRAPERFNVNRFSTCFMAMCDVLLSQVSRVCDGFGDFPHCVTIGSAGAFAVAAVACAIYAFFS
ncbi:MAG TPA: hypothetical protein VFD83_02805 [Candidatus Polarisedimenticolia bacterium]|nr:hypothetical protein [Candidatus Polarisedimenticolia bacterium]